MAKDCLPCGAKARAQAATVQTPRQQLAQRVVDLEHLKLLAWVHKYPPTHNAGAEWMLHHTLRYLNNRGHESRVLVRDQVHIPGGGEVFDGIHITSRPGQGTLRLWEKWATHVITHLDVTGPAMALASRLRLPEVHLVHNHRQLAFHRVRPDPRRLAVFNSQWLRQASQWGGESMVLHPPVPPERYRIEPDGDRIMLFNLSPAKGAALFYALAEANPDLGFTGVAGAYAKQLPPPNPLPANLELVGHDPDVRKLLARARVVLMPSSYESWGRVAIEAGASGIPTIVSTTKGLLESTAGAMLALPVTAERSGKVAGRTTEAVEAPLTDVENWTRGIRAVLADWENFSRTALKRSIEVWATTLQQLSELDRRLRAMAS